jgi:tetratricopeptide (TPR) repeat protein
MMTAGAAAARDRRHRGDSRCQRGETMSRRSKASLSVCDAARWRGGAAVAGLALWVVYVLAAGSAAAQEAPVAADTLDDGSILYRYRESESLNLTPEEKIRELNAAILQDPTNGDLYNNLGVVYAQEAEWVPARDAFLRAVQAKPQEADFHRNLGLVLGKLDEYDMAAREFEVYRKLAPDGGPDAWYLIANAQQQAGHQDEAEETLRKGIQAVGTGRIERRLQLVVALAGMIHERGPESEERELLEQYFPEARAYLERAHKEGLEAGTSQAETIVNNLIAIYIADAEVLAESNLHVEAAEKYKKTYELAPERDELLPRIVDEYLAADEPTKARVAARLAREEHPNSAGSWIATGKVYEHEIRYDEAIEAYLKARELDPNVPGLDVTIGNLYLKVDNVAEGRRFLAGTIGAKGTSPEVIYNYAVSLIKDQKYAAAIEPLRRVTHERPDWPQAWAALASSLRMAGQKAAAIEPYRRALELNPDPKLAFAMGVSARQAGQISTAITAYQQALALDPTYVEARYNLSLAYLAADRYEEAIASFDSLIALEGETYRALFSQGQALYHLGRYDEALEKYEAALSHKETANAYNAMGLVFDKLGDKRTAKQYYDTAKKVKEGG